MQKTEENKKSKRGGARPGAGRPNVKKSTRTIGIRIPADVADILDSVPGSKTDYIIAAIRHYHALNATT